MEQKELFELLARFERSNIHQMKLQQGDFTLELEKAPPAPVAAAPAAPVAVAVSAAGAAVTEAPAPVGEFVKAPLVGTYYASAAPGEEPYATAGKRIAKGQPICLIEAMKSMNEIPAPCDLIVEELLVRDGDLVSYDAPILRYSHV